MGIDIGTSGCKVIVFDDSGRVISTGYKEYSEYSPKPSWIELNPDEVWTKLKSSIKESLKNVDAREIEALSLSVIGEAVLPIDRDGRWLYPAITAYDARSSGYADSLRWWDQKIGSLSLFRITGLPLNSMPSVHKILWIRENMPQIFQRTWKFVCFEDYLIFKLCGEAAISYSLASRTMILDVQRRVWSEEVLETADLDPDLLSKPVASGTIVGEVGSEQSEETGLARGTAIVTGGHDQACGALGVGITKEGPAAVASGSVECVTAAMEKPVLTERMLKAGQCCNCHVVKDMYVTLAFFPSSGIVFRWYRDTFAEKEKIEAEKSGRNVYDLLTEMASKSPVGANRLLLLPHFVGSGTGPSPSLNRNSRGALLGLFMFHKKEDIIRAILEGVAYELRTIIEFLERCKIKVSELRAVGGGAKSPFWLQIKADVTNRRIVVPVVTESSSLGAAILAGIGVKTYTDVKEAVSKVYKERDVYEPNPERNKVYEKYYRVYKRIYPSLTEIFDDLSKL